MIILLVFLFSVIKTLPLYLGIFANDQQDAKVYMRLKVLEAVKLLLLDYPDDQDVQYLYYELTNNKTYRTPPNLHITTFYIGDNANAQDSDYYKNFTPNLQQTMKIYAIALLPKRVIACVVKKSDYDVPIENEFAHITTLLGKWTAVDSNILMASLFNENGPLFNIYNSLFQEPDLVTTYSVLIDGKGEKNLPAYVVKLQTQLQGETQYGYN